MSNVLQVVLRSSLRNSRNIGIAQFRLENIRTLFSAANLGIDKFIEVRENVRRQLGDISSKFKDKMQQYSNESSTSMIFTEDLKNMIYLTNNDEDVQIVAQMMKKFNQQNKQLRFGNFIFGPVVMRMFHVLNKPEEAISCFKSAELQGFFDQLMSYQILLDLLYENQKFNEMLEIFKSIQEKQLQGIKFPKNSVVLVLAACYRLNTPESYDYAAKLWQELNEVGHQSMRRAITFFAGLALNQGHPEQAIEIISSCNNQNYTTIRNIKVSALCDLGRVEDCIPLIKSVLNTDTPSQNTVQTFNKDVIEKVKAAIEKSNSDELKSEMNRIEKFLQEEGHISQLTLDEQLCSEISTPRLQRNQGQQFRNQFGGFRQSRVQRSVGGLTRPGLSDIA
ncbi:pentatricopeptide repeat-containing protein 2, mitochondrial [Agrilus planipennis]|uniref:Pentatricopeptide repeat-containing protein 2, mitochondrial n=1 Tax=Agrilus planipennis TaxID=224129 RepID=A0A1W4WVN5_AGRPL|nr:pentatricopeptide repeat-containing protein 2, mitochondrial [Agrilus planipennis]